LIAPYGMTFRWSMKKPLTTICEQVLRRHYRVCCDGVAYCRMFNEIISGKTLPKYLSSDNDPLYLFHRWKANLRILEIEEIKSAAGCPTSHPYVERMIGSVRREYLNHVLFFNERDLKNKLDIYQTYYNHQRAHSSLDQKTQQK